MNEPVAYVVVAYALFAAAVSSWLLVRGAAFSNGLFYVIAGLEIALVALLVGGVVAYSGTERDIDGLLYFSYLVTTLFIAPAAVLWGIAEKSRWGLGVVTVAMLTVAILVVRCLQIWQGTHV